MMKIIFIYLAGLQYFHTFLRPFNNYNLFFLQLLLSFQFSSINPFSPISPLIHSAQANNNYYYYYHYLDLISLLN